MGAVAILPFAGAALGLAAIAGVNGCHLEVLAVPFVLIIIGAVGAVLMGTVAIRVSRSRRGKIMPAIAVASGLASLAWIAFIALGN